MFYIKQFRLKTLLGGWMDLWVAGKAGLRIAYSNKKELNKPALNSESSVVKNFTFQLFGYGDDANPYTETVDTLEDLVLEFITDMTQRAMDIGRSGRVQVHLGQIRLMLCYCSLLLALFKRQLAIEKFGESHPSTLKQI
jgi:hypothetical protein